MYMDFSGEFPQFPASYPPRRLRQRVLTAANGPKTKQRSIRLPVEADLARARADTSPSRIPLVLPRP